MSLCGGALKAGFFFPDRIVFPRNMILLHQKMGSDVSASEIADTAANWLSEIGTAALVPVS